MNIVSDIVTANSLLEQYRGASFHIRLFSTALWRLGIELRLLGNPTILYVVGAGCKHINGNLYYTHADLEIIQVPGNEQIILIDKQAGFELITTGGITLAQGLETEFGDSFDNFLSSLRS
ncbi:MULTISPECIES: hypothetical protein [unclassified Chitinophaga]|uniref:hypothetical protein n=1 Tax=unclassified Chitinophaga TaxID=2619133 RepID=UPI00300FB5D8